ncbi:MAG: hypothetical protein R3A44_00915 [Caldilineaceae bacterium]
MTKIIVEVHDKEKEKFLLELLSSLEYVRVAAFNGHDDDINELDPVLEANDANPFYQDPRQAQMEKEAAAFEEQHDTLLTLYQGQFVAMYQGKVVDHDADERVLISRVRRSYPHQVILFRQVTKSAPRDFVVHSIRYA